MRSIRCLISVQVVCLTLLSATAWAQTTVTSASLTGLENTAEEIVRQSTTLKRTDPVLAAGVDKQLADLRDDIAVLRVKLRRDGVVPPSEYTDVRTRLGALLARVQAANQTNAPAAPPPRQQPTAPPPTAPPPAQQPVTQRPPTPPPTQQPPPPPPPMGNEGGRIFVNASGASNFSSNTVTATFAFPLYDEAATVSASRKVPSGAFFDVTGGFRFDDTWAVGVSFNSRAAKGAGAVAGSIPDPIAFDSPRSVTGTIPDMAHTEVWIAILGSFSIPVGEKMDISVLFGPALCKLKHDLPATATVTEGSSGPTITIGLKEIKRNFAGYTVGADVQYWLKQNGGGPIKGLGVGGFVRYQVAKANLSSTIKLTLGGLQAGGGIRLRF